MGKSKTKKNIKTAIQRKSMKLRIGSKTTPQKIRKIKRKVKIIIIISRFMKKNRNLFKKSSRGQELQNISNKKSNKKKMK